MSVGGIDNQAASDRVVLDLNSSGEKETQFNQDEILKGTVREIKSDGIVSLLIKGNLVSAASEIKMSPGQQIYLLVDSFKNGITHLKVLEVLETQGVTRMDDTKLSFWLRSLGIPADTDALLIARELLNHNLPVTRQNIEKIINATTMIGGVNARNLAAAVFALDCNIPIDENFFPLVNQFFSSDGDLSQMVRELTQHLSRLDASVRPDLSSSALVATGEEKPVDLAEVVKILRMVLDLAVGKIAGSGADVNPVLQKLVSDRALLLDNLRGLFEMVKTDEVLTKTPEGQELLTRIGNLHQQIVGQALFNSAVKLDQEVLTNHYYFSFPVEIDKQLTYCQLRIQKNTNSRLSYEDNIKLAVSLDTPAFGIVIFHIDWHRQGFIQLQGVVESDEAGRFIEKNISELLLSLGELGYKIGNLGVKTAEKSEELILKPRIKEEEQDNITQFSVDIIA